MPGFVSLVGAGPGDPGLLTLRGLQRLREGDVVVYDRLVNSLLLAECRPDAELVFAGKEPGRHALTQDEINALLIARAREGRRVVRLKGGDPFLFGRGGEEAQALAEVGLPFEVVPGVTSAIAGPAAAGIPVTHRGVAASVAIATAHEAEDGKGDAEWSRLAGAADTLVFLMGVGALREVVRACLKRGLAPETPAAVVASATLPDQRVVVGTLADLADRVEATGIKNPAVIVVGRVVELHGSLRSPDRGPLAGRRILVTRARGQSGALAGHLLDLGAHVVELPLIRIIPPSDWDEVDDAIEGLQRFDWVLLTSANAVGGFMGRLRAQGRDARALARVRVACVGEATALALADRGITADLVPEEYRAQGLLEAMRKELAPGARILLPQGERARQDLAAGLRAFGADVREVVCYRTVGNPEARDEFLKLLEVGGVDAVTLVSSSAVEELVDIAGPEAVARLGKAVVACIGPMTAEAARRAGMEPSVVPERSTVQALAAALAKHFARRGS